MVWDLQHIHKTVEKLSILSVINSENILHCMLFHDIAYESLYLFHNLGYGA